MTWALVALVVLAVCGWAVAAGLYLQLKDALELSKLWRLIANEAWADIVRERHVAEFAVRTLKEPSGQALEEEMRLRGMRPTGVPGLWASIEPEEIRQTRGVSDA